MEECLVACLDVLKLLKDEWLEFILSVGPEVLVSLTRSCLMLSATNTFSCMLLRNSKLAIFALMH